MSRAVEPVLEVINLSVAFGVGALASLPVRDVSLSVGQGEIVGLVGESGSGKTLTGLSCLNLTPQGTVVTASRLSVGNRSVLGMSGSELRKMRGSIASMVFQDPLAGFHPSFSVGAQIQFALMDHGVRRKSAHSRVREVLSDVGLPDPDEQARRFPHQLSGGMLQRAMIALAIANRPQLLIADEPTTAVDPTVQAGLLKLLRGLADDGLGILFITHNLGVVAGLTDRVAVMTSGSVVETESTGVLLRTPQHAYTRALLAAAPRLSAPVSYEQPVSVGVSADQRGAGTIARSTTDDSAWASDMPQSQPLVEETALRADSHGEPIFDLENVTRHFSSGPPWARTIGHALDDISLRVRRGTTLGIVGESGSGKSTLVRLLGLLDHPTSGRIVFEGQELSGLSRTEMHEFRRKVQFIFQNPTASLDPRYSIGDTLTEALSIHGVQDPAELRRRMSQLLGQVHLSERLVARHPSELSGGQRQRVAIARALSARPEVLIADEPVSSLDVTIQAQIMQLLVELKSTQNLTLVMVSHDLALIRGVCDSIITLYNGTLMEESVSEAYYQRPLHPYSQALLAALPDPSIIGRLPTILAKGEPPSPTAPATGCRFHPRCSMAQEKCVTTIPEDVVRADGRRILCHFPIEK